MNLDLVSDVLLAGALLGYALLLAWFAAWTLVAPAIRRLHGRWFAIDPARYDAVMFTLLGVYKIGLWLLFVLPWAALWLARHFGGITP